MRAGSHKSFNRPSQLPGGDRGINRPSQLPNRGEANRNAARDRTPNRDFNRDVDRRVDRDVNIDNDWNIDGDWDWNDRWDGCCWRPLAGAAVAAGAYATAAAIGSVVYTLPPSCTVVIVNDITYNQCGDVWYQPQFIGTSTQYVVVTAPQ
jgi:hypothetical protein